MGAARIGDRLARPRWILWLKRKFRAAGGPARARAPYAWSWQRRQASAAGRLSSAASVLAATVVWQTSHATPGRARGRRWEYGPWGGGPSSDRPTRAIAGGAEKQRA